MPNNCPNKGANYYYYYTNQDLYSLFFLFLLCKRKTNEQKSEDHAFLSFFLVEKRKKYCPDKRSCF